MSLVRWWKGRQHRKFEEEQKRKELEAKLYELLNSDEDFKAFVGKLRAAQRAEDKGDYFSASLLKWMAGIHLKNLIEKYNWSEEPFKEFFEEVVTVEATIYKIASEIAIVREGG